MELSIDRVTIFSHISSYLVITKRVKAWPTKFETSPKIVGSLVHMWSNFDLEVSNDSPTTFIMKIICQFNSSRDKAGRPNKEIRTNVFYFLV